MDVRIIEDNKKDFLDLLLLADEQEDMIDKYLERGTLFALYDDDLKSICVVTDEGNGVFEIQSLATYPEFQGRGYAGHLIDHVCDHCLNSVLNKDSDDRKDKRASMILGTGDVPGILAFYENRGFSVSHRIENYFTEHYSEPMFEDGVQLIDKVYLRRELGAATPGEDKVYLRRELGAATPGENSE